jgi:hypothetical protein
MKCKIWRFIHLDMGHCACMLHVHVGPDQVAAIWEEVVAEVLKGAQVRRQVYSAQGMGQCACMFHLGWQGGGNVGRGCG